MWITTIFTAIKAGFLEKAVEWSFERVKSLFWNKRKKKRRQEDSVTIGKLEQRVLDQGKTIKSLVKGHATILTRLEACQQERTECRADLKNIMFRVSALERRK
jgi:hypothetical protein